MLDVTITGPVVKHESVNPGTSSLTKHLKQVLGKNNVTTFQSDHLTIDNLKKICNNPKIRHPNTTYFSYAGPKSTSKKITLKLGNPINESRVTSDGIVFGIEDEDFKLLFFNDNQKSDIIKFLNEKKNENANEYTINDFNNLTAKQLKDYVCAKFNMDQLLTSITKSQTTHVISHLIISMKGDKLSYTPKKMRLTDKYMTADELEKNVMDFLNKNHNGTSIPKNFKEFFEAISSSINANTKPKTIKTFDISLENISMMKSEMFEIFSAYDLLHRDGFKGYTVYFPSNENTPLYDYVITNLQPSEIKILSNGRVKILSNGSISIKSETFGALYLVSVKNNISVSKNKTKNIMKKFTTTSTTGNTVKPFSFFNTKGSIVHWNKWIKQNINQTGDNKVVYTSEVNNKRVYNIFHPVAGKRSLNFTIGAIKNLLEMNSNNVNVGYAYISDYFNKTLNNINMDNDKKPEFLKQCKDAFADIVKSWSENNSTLDIPSSVSVQMIRAITGSTSKENIDVSDVQKICEKILEFKSKRQSNLTASNAIDNTNYVDIISYLIHRNTRKVIFSSAKYKKESNENTLEIYFQHVIGENSTNDVLSQTWIPLRSKSGGELLGLDLTFYTEPIPETDVK